MDILQVDISINALDATGFDFCEMNSNGTYTRVHYPDPVRLIQEASKQTSISINNIGFNPLLKDKTPIQVYRS